MDISEFRESLLEQIRIAASAEMITDKEAFITYVSEVLTEAEELEDEVIYLPFEGLGSIGRRKIQIDGYLYNELDEFIRRYLRKFFPKEKLVELISNT